jgi:hypothetical protein
MNDNQSPKAQYHQPTFSIYGNLADLTKQGPPAAQVDNQGKSNNMSNSMG